MSAKRKTTARGYGRPHQRLRRAVEAMVASGGMLCSRCGEEIKPGEPWDLDHRDDRIGYNGPAHQKCNRATSKRRKPRRTSRLW